MKTLILVLFSAVAIAADKPQAWECFKVDSLTRIDDLHYQADAVNSCPYTIDHVYVLVKFFDKAWNRIGVDHFSAHFVAPGERIKHVFPISGYAVRRFRYVGVRRITTDALEALL